MSEDIAESEDPGLEAQKPKARAPSRPWTVQEDALLREAVATCLSALHSKVSWLTV